MRLQDAGEHHPDAVQRHLEGEHAQEAGHQLTLVGGVDALREGKERGDRAGEHGQGHGQRGQDHQDQAEQTRGRAFDLLAPTSSYRPGQQWNDRGGQRTADHHLVQDVGDLVGRGVGTRHRPGPDRGGLDDPAREAQRTGDEREARHRSCGSQQPAAGAGGSRSASPHGVPTHPGRPGQVCGR